MNSWVSFLKTFYAAERAKDSSKCRNRVTLKDVAKVYNCKKTMANRSVKHGSKFRGKNPMHRRTKKKH
jgi:hypothetical protein